MDLLYFVRLAGYAGSGLLGRVSWDIFSWSGLLGQVGGSGFIGQVCHSGFVRNGW